ncbi:MAG: hypothetical protein HY509_04330, partial [Acidobacteria bacterium]|nr:hypothetical protein [Acidobacteriota bacterium]
TLFVNISNDQYRPDPQVAVAVIHQVSNPGDDFPVLLFLSAESGRGLDEIWRLRLRGMTWSAILVHVGVDPAHLFAGMDRDPGPPYGKAWGYWRKHGARPATPFQMVDADFVSLVKVRITSDRFGLNPTDVLKQHRSGRKVETIAREKHQFRGGHAPGGPTGKASNPGQGKGGKRN